MRRSITWMSAGILAVLVLTLWGVWTWRLNTFNHVLSHELEAERQRNFNDMAFHVEQIQSLLAKGLVAGSVRQNMRYMGDVHYHSQAAVRSFSALPLPPEIRAATGRFLQQTADFALSLLRNEAAGRDMDAQSRQELGRLRQTSAELSAQVGQIALEYNRGGFRWNPPLTFTWAGLAGRNLAAVGKPNPSSQAPENMLPGGWEQIGQSMGKLPVFLYDGPFSDHVAQRAPAVTGPAVSKEDAARRLAELTPNFRQYQIVDVTDVNNNLPAFSFRLAPAAAGANAGRGGPAAQYTAVVDVAKNGGHLVGLLNFRVVGNATLDLERARIIGQEYLANAGYRGMVPTYGQVQDGTATIAYAYREQGVLMYPDQIKVKVALDNGEVLAVDARQYLMAHHARTLPAPQISPQKAQEALNGNLAVERVQLALIPGQAGTGEILTYEFLTSLDGETFLIYVNANTGMEEQILQQVDADGGTFTL